MANIIPSDTHNAGDANHTPDHNNIADVLGLLAQTFAAATGTPAPTNTTAITALQNLLTLGTGSLRASLAVDTIAGMTQQFIQWSSGVTTFPAVPGILHLASAAGGNITVQLPSTKAVPPGSALIVKRVDSAGNTVTVAPVTGEKVNGISAGVVLSQQGQGRWFLPGAPTGAAAGTGWMSF